MMISTNNNLTEILCDYTKQRLTKYVRIYKKEKLEDSVYWNVITNSMRTVIEGMTKEEFAIKKASLFSPILSVDTRETDDYIIIEYYLKHVDSSFYKDIDEEAINRLFEKYINSKYINEVDVRKVIERELLDFKNLKSTPTKYAMQLSRDLSIVNRISLSDSLKCLEKIKFEDIVSFMKNKKPVSDIEVTFSKNKIKTHFAASNYKNVSQEIAKYRPFEDYIKCDTGGQSSISMHYLSNEVFPTEVVQVFNAILGSDSQSLLFTNVREAHSLCYQVASMPLGKQGVLCYIGLDKANASKAMTLIDEQIELIKNGDFDDFEGFKSRLIDEIKKKENDFDLLVDRCVNKYFYELSTDLEYRISKINSVDIGDIKKFATAIKKSGKVEVS